MKILAFDISKKATGIAFFNQELKKDSLLTLKFKDSVQWANKVIKVIEKLDPDVITFSETVNRMCGQSTKRIMFGLMFLLEDIAFRKGISIIPINDSPAKNNIGVKFGRTKQIKKDTLEWVLKTYGITPTEDEADAITFAVYVNKLIVKK